MHFSKTNPDAISVSGFFIYGKRLTGSEFADAATIKRLENVTIPAFDHRFLDRFLS